MSRLVWILSLCLMFASAAVANPKADAEAVAKESGHSFHWFPIQKTFILVAPGDTVKFAVGNPFAAVNDQIVELAEPPILESGHLWLNSADAQRLFKIAGISSSSTATVSSSSSAAPLSSAVQSSSAVAQSSSAAQSSSSAPAADPAAPAQAVPAAPVAVAATVPAAPKNETAGTREVKTIVIDPGHGGKDSGAQGKKSNEKDIVLAIGKLLKKELEKEGFKVKMTRDKDEFIELGQRANLANQWDGDLFISLHCNAIDASAERKKQIKGYHVYVLRAPESEEDKAIARRENKVATLYGEKNAKEELSPIEWFKLEARLEKYKQNSYMFTEEMLKAFEGGKIRRQAGGVGGAGFMVLVGALMPAVL